MIRFAADANLNDFIVRGLLRRRADLDIVRIRDTTMREAGDPAVLEWAAAEGRVVLTHDVSTMTKHAYERVRAGGDHVLSQSKEPGSATSEGLFHLFLVEGLVDALRLESLAIPAVAILGSSLSEGQIEVLSRVAQRLDRVDQVLVVHVFLDTDDPGRRAAVRLLPNLLRVENLLPARTTAARTV